MVHEYFASLGPPKTLLQEFKEAEAALNDHDKAFEQIEYESKFNLSPEGHGELARLAEIAKNQRVYLICHCAIGQYCHRELLLIMAQAYYDTPVETLSHPYQVFRERLKSLRD